MTSSPATSAPRGIQAALIRRAKEGGSYHVRVNLARCAMWFMSLGTFDKAAPTPTGEQHQLLAPDTITAQTPYGELVRLAPPVSSPKPSPIGRTRYWWCAGQASRDGQTADSSGSAGEVGGRPGGRANPATRH